VITDAVGNIKLESDYYPWGGELQFVNNDSNHYKFTGKERDSETGLDYFGARYYSNGLGRFITPDWAAKAAAVPYADFADPQSLNLYTYVRNIPTSRVDADGHDILGDAIIVGIQIAGPAIINTANAALDRLADFAHFALFEYQPHSVPGMPFPPPGGGCGCSVPPPQNNNNNKNNNNSSQQSSTSSQSGQGKSTQAARAEWLLKRVKLEDLAPVNASAIRQRSKPSKKIRRPMADTPSAFSVVMRWGRAQGTNPTSTTLRQRQMVEPTSYPTQMLHANTVIKAKGRALHQRIRNTQIRIEIQAWNKTWSKSKYLSPKTI
jgi:RHS repeat-associated protein